MRCCICQSNEAEYKQHCPEAKWVWKNSRQFPVIGLIKVFYLICQGGLCVLAMQSVFEESLPRPSVDAVRGEMMPSCWVLQPIRRGGQEVTRVIYLLQVRWSNYAEWPLMMVRVCPLIRWLLASPLRWTWGRHLFLTGCWTPLSEDRQQSSQILAFYSLRKSTGRMKTH